MATILITGGTGLVGNNLTKKLIEKGHKVRILSRSKIGSKGGIDYYRWNVGHNEIDNHALIGVDSIVHLAGAGVADGPWSERYKKEIIDSRVDSIQLLFKKCQALKAFPTSIISASGTAFYGFDNSDKIYDESAKAGEGFLTEVSEKWEQASADFEKYNVRRVVLRIGVVLSDKGGALSPIKMPFQFGIGSAMGTGKQPFPWIHIDDLTNAIIHSINNQKMNGVFNAVAPETVTNGEFSKTLAQEMGKPFWAPNVPSFVLRIILGKEKADEMLLNGAHVSSKKLEEAGLSFQFPKVSLALKEALK
ncbi:MAG: TIGR01777 family oxidoreductase [Bacteroidetes bacterium]|nr:TIGR01777 family oxidoreductase [Bacteroidota bacterium]